MWIDSVEFFAVLQIGNVCTELKGDVFSWKVKDPKVTLQQRHFSKFWTMPSQFMNIVGMRIVPSIHTAKITKE
jgi:hypothetical protein